MRPPRSVLSESMLPNYMIAAWLHGPNRVMLCPWSPTPGTDPCAAMPAPLPACTQIQPHSSRSSPRPKHATPNSRRVTHAPEHTRCNMPQKPAHQALPPSGLDSSKHCSIRRWLHQALIIRQASSGLARPASLPKGTAPGLQSTPLFQANAAFTAADTAPISALPANCALAAAISLPISAAVGLRLLSASNAAAMACTAAAISASLMRAGK